MRTNHLNLLLVLVLVLFPMSTRAYGADECVMLYTPYTKIAVPPGESINYSVDVINNCGEVKNASISVLGMPRGWKYEMKAGGWTVDQISVLPGEKKNFSFKVDVPFKVNKGTYHFTLTAPGVAELPLTVTVSEQGTYQTEFVTKQPNMQGNSKSTFNFNTTLKNQTADQQLYALMADVPRGWNVTFRVAGKPLLHKWKPMRRKISVSILIRRLMCRRALIRFRSVRQLVRPLPISSWRWLSLVPMISS